MQTITHFIFMGDSLSDRGTLDHEELLGCLPMSYFGGLEGISPQGSFTNGFVWTDYVGASIVNHLMIKDLESRDISADDISDAIINKDEKIYKRMSRSYNLDSDTTIKFKGKSIIRDYCIGGLSSYDYHWAATANPKLFFTRLSLSNLQAMRKKLIQYDKDNHISLAEKAATLVIEWSGANDLITVNPSPTKMNANKAIEARVHNLQSLIKRGYRHFVLIDLPDLSLTPRYQARKEGEQKNLSAVCKHFNLKLENKLKILRFDYPDCTFDMFQASKIFKTAYQNPARFHLDKDKLKIAFVNSPDFKIEANGTSPAKGYMFWNDVHPSANVHSILGERFYNKYSLMYQFAGDKLYHSSEEGSEEEGTKRSSMNL